ncbi:MAG TPA: hypothetical protein VN894_09815, partial [Polyangiaceae bacterium]|nr:hypothetical protein [Polyangiaceae bacterium]
ERLDTDTDPRVRRRIREVMRDLAEPKRATETLREELEKLQGEHSELKARMAKIEARVAGDGDAAASIVTGAGAEAKRPKRKGAKKGRKA